MKAVAVGAKSEQPANPAESAALTRPITQVEKEFPNAGGGFLDS